MKDKNYDSLDVARRIRAAGRPIYIAQDDGSAPSIPSEGLRVRQWGGLVESRAIACGSGTAFIIQLVITSQLPTFAISSFGLQPPWKNDYLNWLEDPLLTRRGFALLPLRRQRCPGVREGARDQPLCGREAHLPLRTFGERIFIGLRIRSNPRTVSAGHDGSRRLQLFTTSSGANIALLWSCRWCGTRPNRVSCGSATCSNIAIRFRAVRGRSSCGSQSAGGFVINVMATTRAAP